MDKKYWNLLMADQLDRLSLPEQFAAGALAFLDSAHRLCIVLSRSPRKATFERGVVVLYLAVHSIELFLKGAILRKAALGKLAHDLDCLYERYEELYPESRYKLQIPFRTNCPDSMSPSDKQAFKKRTPPPDQLFRYPTDRLGKSWGGAHGFEANSFKIELTTLRQDFERLIIAYDNKPQS